MRIYPYHPITKDLLIFEDGLEALADPNPLATGDDDAWLIPAYATSVAPPESIQGKGLRFDLDAGDWTYYDLPVPAAPTPQEIAAIEQKKMASLLTQFRRDREQYLSRLNGMYAEALYDNKPDIASACMAVVKGLKDLPANAAVLAATDSTTLASALKSAYENMLNVSIPSNLRQTLSSAFAALDRS